MTLCKFFRYNATFLLPALLVFVAGCESTPTATEQNFGASVRHMIEVQTAQTNKTDPGLDGQKAEAVLDAYRKDVAKPKDVERDLIQIKLGN